MRPTQLRKIRKTRLARHQRSSLARSVFEHLLQALTGASPVPAALVRRAVANGLPPAELANAISSAKRAERLPDYLYTVCHQKLEQAIYWEDLGLRPRARDNYLESALWGIFADLLSFHPQRKAELFQQYRASYAKAAPYLASPAMPITVNYLATPLSGYFRIPVEFAEQGLGEEPMPCAILLNDIAAPKEELHFTENSLLTCGIATLSLDYPGAVEHGGQPYTPFDLAELGNSIYFLLSSLPEVDLSRLVLYGIGFGARMALYLSITAPDRFKCVTSISAPLDVLADTDKLAGIVSREHFISEVQARTALMDLAAQTPVEDDLGLLSSALLVVGGGKDGISLPEETQYIYEHASSSDKKLILCPGAHHNVYDMMPSLRYEIAQWIKQRV